MKRNIKVNLIIVLILSSIFITTLTKKTQAKNLKNSADKLFAITTTLEGSWYTGFKFESFKIYEKYGILKKKDRLLVKGGSGKMYFSDIYPVLKQEFDL